MGFNTKSWSNDWMIWEYPHDFGNPWKPPNPQSTNMAKKIQPTLDTL